MRLTTHTDYALRVLIFLGLHPAQRVTIQEVAQHYGISHNHLMKVVHRLGSEGYVRTVRGKHGGVVLAQPPGRLRIGALVRDMEEEFNLVECFGTGSHCQIGAVCRLRNSLSQALDAFMRVLNQYTLADLIANRHALRRALHLAPAPAPPKRQRRHSLPSRNDGRQARSTLLP